MEISDLIELIDIVDYISQFVELEEKNGEHWGLSPFRSENTPSFSVRRESRQFYDFSSGVGGNVFTFVRYYNKCSSAEAVEILKKYIGSDAGVIAQTKRLPATMVCKRFVTPKQKQVIKPQNVYPECYMERYEKRDDKLAVWGREGISKASMDKFQVYYDNFSNRLVYPIRDLSGDIVNIGGRTLDADWKSKGLRKYTYFSGWGEMNVIYGLYDNIDEVVRKKEVILFEGCKSVLIADTWGIRNTGAILTSHLNPCQMKILARLGVTVIFALDKDVRIKDDRNIEKLKRYVNVEYIWDRQDLLDAKDAPVDKGKEVFSTLYGQRLTLR